MIPTVQNIFDLTRSVLGDTEVLTGQIFTNAFLFGANNSGPFSGAYEWLFERMRTYNDRRTRRTTYAVINPNISIINPATIGIQNMGAPVDIWERAIASPTGTYAVTGATLTPASSGVDPYCQLAVAHGGAIVSGQQIDTYLIGGLSDDVNGEWYVNVPDNNHINLMGCTAVGTYTSGGIVIVPSTAWPGQPMNPFWDLNDFPLPTTTNQTTFDYWCWQFGQLQVPPVTTAREIRIAFDLSGSAPTSATASVGIDDSLNPLAYRTAWIASAGKKSIEDAEVLKQQSEQFLDQFLQPSTKNLQRERFVAPRWRQKRNTGLYNPY
jgi:hypothetical protein